MTPRATYRLQFQKSFGFRDAARIAPYLAQVGISHVYASPWLKARPGSSHGYDIVDHHALNPELGSQEDFDAMVAAFRANGLRQILDFIPNHMGVGGADNPLWLDVLEWGPDSACAGWFDIDWQSNRTYLHGKLLVPFLGDQYGAELYAGKLALKFDAEDGSFAVWAYGTHKLPVRPIHYGHILGSAHPELERLGDEFASLPEWRPQAGRRARELKDALAQAARERRDVADAVAAAVEPFNGTPGLDDTWKALDALIQDQHWRAASFRVAADDINYRRFFNINELAGIRMELPDVFDHTHAFVFRLLDEGILDGLRIDHVDGLLNPKQYFQRLRAHGFEGYLVVEKILAHYESLREDWQVDGTTGYEFANLVLGLLIDPAGEEAFTQAYADFAGGSGKFPEIVRECKLRIMRNEMASELDVLARDASRVAQQNPRTADFTHNVLRISIREVVACYPVYRTYVDSESAATEEDLRYLNWAMTQARAKDGEIDPSVYDFVQGLFSAQLLEHGRNGFSRHAVLRCAMKLQQYSGPVMAKGLEDTAFYRYNRFVALNEVGGNPEQFGTSPASFHKANAQRAKRWPKSMLTTSTHDTKRGEDTRARLAVLSELPAEWKTQVETWSRILRARRADIQATAPPDRNDEYLFYQLLIGTWPVELTGPRDQLDPVLLGSYVERLKGAMTKSMREARVHSTWSLPNREYEDAVLLFVDHALDAENSGAFFSSFLPFQERVARLGVHNSLIQTMLKMTAPGVPDFYQGAELWDLSLVDPDNRRPVDYEHRIRLLDRLHQSNAEPRTLLDCWQDGSIKLLLISRVLQLRAAEPDLFSNGEYEPISATGPKADCICGFLRRHGEKSLVVLAARFPARLESDSDWSGTSVSLPVEADSTLDEWITGAAMPVFGSQIQAESAFKELPVAILFKDGTI